MIHRAKLRRRCLFATAALLTLFCLTGLCTPRAWAQASNASLAGVVADPSGAVVPSAKITLTDVDKGFTYAATTDEAGRYLLRTLPPSTYRLTVEASGFKGYIREGIQLYVGQNSSVDVKLELGSTTQAVEVHGSAPLLHTQDAVTGQEVNRTFMNDLPLNGRDPFDLAFLAPGTLPTAGSSTSSGSGGNNFISNGMRNVVADVLLDGTTLASYQYGARSLQWTPSLETVQEFKIQQNNFSAETGFSGGTVINLVMRSGTNQFHGDVYDFLRNQALDSNNWFNNAYGIGLPPLRYNDFGVTFGGPIQKDKTFFFASYEGTRTRSLSNNSGGVPSAAEKTGDFGELCGGDGPNGPAPGATFNAQGMCSNPNGQIWDPYTGIYNASAGGPVRSAFIPFNNLTNYQSPGNPNLIGTPFQLEAAPGNLINPSAYAIMQYFPAPNAGVGTSTYNPYLNFYAIGANLFDTNQYEFRIDRRFGDHLQVNGRFGHDANPSRPPSCYGNVMDPCASNPGSSGSTTGAVNATYSFGPNTVLDITAGMVRGGWVNTSISNEFPSFNVLKALDLPAYMLDGGVNTTPMYSISPYGAPGGVDNIGQEAWSVTNVSRQTPLDLLVSVDHIRGQHDFKTGVQLRIMQQNNFEPSPTMGWFFFDALGTSQYPNSVSGGDGMATFMTGTSTDNSGDGGMTIPTAPAATSKEYGAYFQDKWRATEKLTVNLGLRWDLELPATDRENRFNYFDPTMASPLQVPGLPNLVGGDVFTSPKNRWILPDPYYKEFQPRIGLAYRLTPKTVLRGGYGLFFNLYQFGPGESMGLDGATSTSPQLTTWNNDGATPWATINNPFPGGPIMPTGSSQGALTNVGLGISGPNPQWNKTGYTQTWSVGFQHELGGGILLDANYVGTKGTALPFGGFNSLDYLGPSVEHASADQITALNSYVANPFYGVITNSLSSLSSQYVQQAQLELPFPQYTGMDLDEPPWANSIYNAFQLRVEKRFSRGLQFLASYTNSKSIDDASIQGAGMAFLGGWGHSQDPNNLKLERALSEYDIPQVFQIAYVYQLPFGQGMRWGGKWNSWVNGFLGGWQTNGIWRISSGQPIGFSLTNGKALPGGYGQQPNLLTPLHRAGGPESAWMQQYFSNPQVAVTPAPFTLGTGPPLLPNVRSPGAENGDLSLFKEIPLKKMREGSRLEFRLEAFNALNHPQFGGPNASVNSGSFGVVGSQINSPREVQLGLKLYW